MCAADPTGISYSFGIDSLRPHLIAHAGRAYCIDVLKRIIRSQPCALCAE